MWLEGNDSNIGMICLSSQMLCGQKAMTATLGGWFEFTYVMWSENNDSNIGRIGLSSQMLCSQKIMTATLGGLV